ncbi:SRPBCC family protein [Sphingomonas sp. KC8]|uniref:SRPBCC family protein n=1 Tax=Sphingomonas sp. KC8 TaxID=1030157 RepID=UPI00024886A5|nr:SRPBCC domain-containing protein [Sphingomonas sp. KC8]ARS28704.1 polyketide cyclase/dehydrase [Sphingomonas sp. KC8]
MPAIRIIAAAAAAIALFPSSARGEVVAATSGGFAVTRTAIIAATPAQTYAALARIGQWWNGEHTYSGKAGNLTLEPRVGGCFCETLPDGGAVEHMRVIFVQPGRLIRLTGALGPLQSEGVAGALTWTIAADGKGTRITQSYVVGGHVRGGADKMAAPVDQVLGEQLDSLKAYLEMSAK